MADLKTFRNRVSYYLRQAEIMPGEKSRTTQADLAAKVHYSREEFNRILNGKSAIPDELVHSIVSALSDWRAIKSKGQARELLNLMDVPDFNLEDWKAEPLVWLKDVANDSTSRQSRPGVSADIDKLPEPRERLVTKVDWGEAPHIEQFYGRDKELAELEEWIVDDHCRIVAAIGIGGVGKTALAAKLVEQIKDKFEYLFWRSLQNAPSVESILKSCINFVSNQQQIDLPEDVNDQISSLIAYLREHRCLVVLDNFESVLQAGHRTGQYRGGYEGYGRLIQRIGEARHHSCLLLTSREMIKEIALLEGRASPIRSLPLVGVGHAEGREILKDKGLIGSDEVQTALIDLYAGNPLALKLASASIQEVFKGDVARFLREEEAVFGDIHDLLEQQFNRLSVYEREIMYWLAIEREAVSLEDVRKESILPVSKGALLEALDSLRRRSMVEISGTYRFTLQPVIMEYVTDEFIEQVTEEIETEKIALFGSHALIKAQAKDYVRESQVRIILAPVAQRLITAQGQTTSGKKLKRILSSLREVQPHIPSYAAGNILNLLVELRVDLRDTDFSHLKVWQAYLRDAPLPGVNFTHADLSTSVFTDTFGNILSVALSPNGALLASGTANGEIRVWQMPNGTPLLTYQGHTDWVWSIAFNPEGNILVSSSSDQTIKLWEVSSGHCLNTLLGHSSWVRSVAFSPDGKTLASGSADQTIKLWEVESGHCLKTLQEHTNQICSIVFSPDGNMLASGSADQTVKLWELDSGHCLNTLQGHSSWVRAVAFSPDGRYLASGSHDLTVRVYEVGTGLCFKILQGHTNRVRSLAFSSDGSMLASGSEDQTVRLWEMDSGQCSKTLQGHANRVCSVTFSPDGTTLASGNEDRMIRLWEVGTGQCLKSLQGHTNPVWCVAFNPDGSLVASASEDQSIRVWNVDTGRSLKILRGHGSRVCSVTFSPDGSMLASSSEDQTVRLWNVSTGICLNVLQEHTAPVWTIAFSPDGDALASCSEDLTVRLWDVSTGLCLRILQGHTNRVFSVSFSPDGNMLASGSEDLTIRLWDVSTGLCLRILQGHTNRIRSGSLAYSPDGNTLASGSEDQTIRLWDVSTGLCLKVLSGHTEPIWSVAFSPDGCIVASGGEDRTIKLWDAQTGNHQKTLRSERPYEHMNINGATGLTEVQKATLKILGAIDDEMETL